MKAGPVGKAVGKELPKAAPVLLWIGIGFIAWKFGSEILAKINELLGNLGLQNKDPGVVSSGTAPKTEDSPSDRLSGKILAPKIGDTVTSAGLTSFTYSMTLEVTNPFENDRASVLTVQTHEYPHLMPETGSTWSDRFVLKPGRNVLKATIRRASIVNFGTTIPAFAQLLIDGRAAVQAVNYEIE